MILRIAFSLLLTVGLFFQSGYSLDPTKKITQYGHLYWNELNGLPQNYTHFIIQAPDGYLWISTQEGLVRFDGVHFTIYTKTNTPILTNNYFTALHYDTKGNLWIGTSGGGIFKYSNGIFSTPLENTNMEEEIIYNITTIGDTVYYGTDNGVRVEGEKVKKWIRVEDGLSNKTVRSLYADNGIVWLGTRGGVDKILPDGTLEHLIHPAFSIGVDCIWKDKKNVLWFGTHGNGLFYMERGAIMPFAKNNELPGLFIRSLTDDKDGNLWIGTTNGLARLNQYGFDVITKENGLKDDFIFHVMEDKEGSLWLASRGGLTQFYNVKFTCISIDEGLPTEDINAVMEDRRGRLWVSTYGKGVAVIDGKNIRLITAADGLGHDTVYSLYEDRAGNIWAGHSRGLSVYNGTSWKSYGLESGFRTTIVKAMLEDDQGRLWVCTEDSGVYIRNGERFVETINGVPLPKDDAFAIFKDSAGNMWIGTINGLYKYDGKSFNHFTKKENGLANDLVICFFEDTGRRLWIGTENGLSVYERGRFYTITTENGFPNDVILSLTADKERRLWIGCNKGVFTVYIDDLMDVVYGKKDIVGAALYGRSDGMRSSECNGGFQPSVWKRKSGELVFPTMNGIAMIQPDLINPVAKEFPVVIERIVSNTVSYQDSERIKLPAGSQSFEIEYTAISFENPHRIQFQYYMKGFDKKWTEAGTRRTAYYTNVPPGSYVFTVKAVNTENMKKIFTKSVIVVIKPYFYQSKWFYASLLILLGGGVFGFYRIRMHALKQKEKELARLVAERTKELEQEQKITEMQTEKMRVYNSRLKKTNKDLVDANREKTQFIHIAAHDLKNPLQSIIGYTELIRTQIEADSMIAKNIGKVSDGARKMFHIISELLENAEIEGGAVKLDKKEIDASLVVQSIVASYRDAAQIKNQIIHITTDGNTTMVTDEMCLRRITDNLISNAVKYSPQGKPIYVSLSGDDLMVTLSVRDEGPGFLPEDREKLFGKFQRLSAKTTGGETSTGLGLSIVKSLTDLLGGVIYMTSEPGLGAVFTVKFRHNGKIKAK